MTEPVCRAHRAPLPSPSFPLPPGREREASRARTARSHKLGRARLVDTVTNEESGLD